MKMTAKPSCLLLLAIIFINSCFGQPLIPKDTSHALEAKNNLFAFVGKKMSFENLPYEKGSMDRGFRATCKILERVYGDYTADTISFEAYDHYGKPAFEQYENVLLYVVRQNDKFYHVKYQFSPVYLTRDGRWAGVYSVNPYHDSVTVMPEKIEFARAVTFLTSAYFFNGMITCIEKDFPTPYYRIDRDTAIAVYGYSLEQLFQIEKENGLSEFFSDTLVEEKPIQIQEVILEDIPRPVNEKTDQRFILFAKLFMGRLTTRDTLFLSHHLLDTLNICDRKVSGKDFTREKKGRIWDKRFIEEVIPEGNTEYMVSSIGENSPDLALKHMALRPRVLQIHLSNKRDGLIHYYITLKFIETSKGYMLVSMTDPLYRPCIGREYDPSDNFT